MTLKLTPRRFTLGFHLPEVHSRSLRELEIFALADHDFVAVALLKSLDEAVCCSVSIFLRTFGFHPVATSCGPTSDGNSMGTAERLKMTV